LGLGLMVKVSPGLVTRRKTHFHRLPCGVTVILSNNGYIWISPMTGKNAEEEGVSALSELPLLSEEDRQIFARVRNCIVVLADNFESLTDTSIVMAYESAERFPPKDILRPMERKMILQETRVRIENLARDI
ncbi:unnamed protein product, partial [Notodromas monacha]